MERLNGGVVDKAKYRRLIMELLRLKEQQRQQRQGSGRSGGKNEHLERFKFWLGMPNTYFGSGEWDWHEEFDATNGER